MPAELRCQSCETVVPTPESSAGQSVACPGCGARIFVPTTDADDAIALKLPSGINLNHRAGVFGDSDAESDSDESRSTGASSQGSKGRGISEGIPRLAIAGADDDSVESIPLSNPAAEIASDSVRRHKPDNPTMVPRLPVLEKPSAPGETTSRGKNSDDGIQLRPPEEPSSDVGISDSLIDMMTSQDNRVWREERAKRQAEEAVQQSIFRFGVLCCGIATTLTISVGLPFVLAASNARSERSSKTVLPRSQPDSAAEKATAGEQADD